jgi:hypothetical protein
LAAAVPVELLPVEGLGEGEQPMVGVVPVMVMVLGAH